MAVADHTPKLADLPAALEAKRLARSCVHCGLCLSACPTYRVLGSELDSPRGRIFQMKLALSGEIEPDHPRFNEHIFQCLACRACETACPSGVRYGQLVELARGWIPARTSKERLLRRVVFGRILPSPAALKALGVVTRLYQASGVQWLVRATGLLDRVAPTIAKMESLLPEPRTGVLLESIPEETPARGPATRRIGLVTGCIASEMFAPTNAATVRVLAENGCEVVAPSEQRCCGALAVHSGERVIARNLARRNIAAFERAGVDTIVVNAAGCGSTLKEYGELLEDDPRWTERARAFSARVKDVSELLVELPFRPPTAEVRRRVTYQDACHLAHGQRVREQPRQILRSIPGVELVEMKNSDYCCGSAGIYNITHSDIAEEILDEKMATVVATHPDTITAANPGCLLQLGHGARKVGLEVDLLHPVELLDEAYRRERG